MRQMQREVGTGTAVSPRRFPRTGNADRRNGWEGRLEPVRMCCGTFVPTLPLTHNRSPEQVQVTSDTRRRR
jgi:hypothetical protein